jgi:hypothetical protein
MTLQSFHRALPIFAAALCFLLVLLFLVSFHPLVQGQFSALAVVYRPEAMFPGH